MLQKGFTHLHLHSEYSLLDGAIAFKKLLKHCKDLEMDSVAVTDHGNLFGAVEFYTKAKAAHIKLETISTFAELKAAPIMLKR